MVRWPQPLQFLLISAGLVIAALYHLAALTVPTFARVAYSPTYPAVRHVVFIGLDFTFAYLVLRRPHWLIWLALALTVQILNGHGVRLWHTLFDSHRIQWIDLITVTGALFAVVVIWRDRQSMIR